MKQYTESGEKLRTCGVKGRLFFKVTSDSSPYLYIMGMNDLVEKRLMMQERELRTEVLRHWGNIQC